ncbi:anthranilate phosphoribosyltransferase [Oenococcus sp. UCMA 14587]|nr:anthranilate phosphoribosyltransferase [Oenococcus sp. UCMA 14587]
MIKEAISTLSNKKNLDFKTSAAVIDEIMSGKATNAQIAGFLTALAIKKATIDEIAGAASAMRQHALAFNSNEKTLEIVGTGGDRSNSFNISTTAAFVIAAAGVPVTKHGNRAASSKSGAADVLEALGIKIDLEPVQAQDLLHKINLTFMFAQKYHAAMRFVAPSRKELGIPTIFNILGPLANPANPQVELLGVYDESLLDPMAHVLDRLGVISAMVVHSQDGLDEISPAAVTDVEEVFNHQFRRYTIRPEQFGLTASRHKDLIGGSARENAQITRDVLAGKAGAPRDAVLMNAAAALYLAKKETSLESAFQLAKTTIDSGRAQQKLTDFINYSQQVFVL